MVARVRFGMVDDAAEQRCLQSGDA
jgi:hypothetical protein